MNKRISGTVIFLSRGPLLDEREQQNNFWFTLNTVCLSIEIQSNRRDLHRTVKLFTDKHTWILEALRDNQDLL